MHPPIACMICAVDPATTSLLLPLAQATLISAPILLRGRISRGIRAFRAHRRGAVVQPGPAEARDRHEERLDR